MRRAAAFIRPLRAALPEKGQQGGAGFHIVMALSATLMTEARGAYDEEA